MVLHNHDNGGDATACCYCCCFSYFSKEKKSHEDYNLACILTFPPYVCSIIDCFSNVFKLVSVAVGLEVCFLPLSLSLSVSLSGPSFSNLPLFVFFFAGFFLSIHACVVDLVSGVVWHVFMIYIALAIDHSLPTIDLCYHLPPANTQISAKRLREIHHLSVYVV